MPLPALILLLALAGCGSKPAPTATSADGNATSIAIAPDEEPAPSGEAAGITAIDAATGDGRAMPADSAAPSAYDLAQRAERAKDREAAREARAAVVEPAVPGVAASDEPVAAGD